MAKLSRTPIPTVELFWYPVQKKTVDTVSIFNLYFLVSSCTTDSRTWKDSWINNNDTGNIFKYNNNNNHHFAKSWKWAFWCKDMNLDEFRSKEIQMKHWWTTLNEKAQNKLSSGWLFCLRLEMKSKICKLNEWVLKELLAHWMKEFKSKFTLKMDWNIAYIYLHQIL